MTLLAFAADRRAAVRRAVAPAAVDRYLLPVGHPAANPPHAAATVDRWDRRTDGRTSDRYVDPAGILCE